MASGSPYKKLKKSDPADPPDLRDLREDDSENPADDDGDSGEYTIDESEFEDFGAPGRDSGADSDDSDESPGWGMDRSGALPPPTRHYRDDGDDDDDGEEELEVVNRNDFKQPGRERNSYLRRLHPNSREAHDVTRYFVQGTGSKEGYERWFYKAMRRKDLIRRLYYETNGEDGDYQVTVFVPRYANKPEPKHPHAHFYVSFPHDHPDLAEHQDEARRPAVFRQEDFDFTEVEGAPADPPADLPNDSGYGSGYGSESDLERRMDELQRSLSHLNNPTPAMNYPQPPPPQRPQDNRTAEEKMQVWAGVASTIVSGVALPLFEAMKPKESMTDMLKAVIDIGKDSQRPAWQDLVGSFTPVMAMMLAGKSGIDMSSMMGQQGQQQGQQAQQQAQSTAIAPSSKPSSASPAATLDDVQQQRRQPESEPESSVATWWREFVDVNTKNPRKERPDYWAHEIMLSSDEFAQQWLDTTDDEHAQILNDLVGDNANPDKVAEVPSLIRRAYTEMTNVQRNAAQGDEAPGSHQHDVEPDPATNDTSGG